MHASELWLIARRLTYPETAPDERSEHYAELRGLSDQLKLRDLQRHSEVVTFSNGLQFRTEMIADTIKRSSIADFCIWAGLSRREVLERTGLGKAGVS